MRRLVFMVTMLACLVSCKTDLTDINGRLDEVEAQGNKLDQRSQELQKKSQELAAAIEALKKQSEALKNEWDKLSGDSQAIADAIAALQQKSEELEAALAALREEGDALTERNAALLAEWERLQELVEAAKQAIEELEAELRKVEPKVLKMEFLASDNVLQLVENTTCEIVGDSSIECRISNITTDKQLIPRIQFQGDYVSIAGREVVSGVTQVDFSKPRELIVYANEKSKKYVVTVSSYTGLKTVWIEVDGRPNILNTTQSYNATIKLVDNVGTRAGGDLAETKVKIKGVGVMEKYDDPDPHETTYLIETMGKNAYTLQFAGNVTMMNEPSSKTWDLRTNRDDISMLHNQTAFYVSGMSKLDYTPSFHYADLMLNGRYYGTYMLGDHLDVAQSRVNVGSDGFILNISSDASSIRITTANIEQPIGILAPTAPTAEARSYIQNFMNEAESALFSSNFTATSTGWQKYLDMDSFVDWYLINEIAMNTNGAFKTNCIMNLARGGKLKMGPVWDFEKAFGNNRTNAATTGFVIKNVKWYARLFQDPAFVARVKSRFNYFYSHQDEIYNAINENAQFLEYAIKEDDEKWNTFKAYRSPNSTTETWILYQNVVLSMKQWLNARMQWLKGQFDAMG